MSGLDTTSTLTDSVRARYQNEYEEQIFADRVYDMLAKPVGENMADFVRGSSVYFPFISKMDIATSAINEVTDVVPQQLADTTKQETPTSRGAALQQSELLRIQNYAKNFQEEVRKVVAENATESIDLVAQSKALTGNMSYGAAARASLDAGTSGNRLSDATLGIAENMLFEFKVPLWMDGSGGSWFALVPPDAYTDLRTGGNILSVGQYQRGDIILNHELGRVGKFRIIVAPWAKVFGAAGADNASNAATTLAAAANKLDLTIEVASASNITVGRYLTIGTEETGNTHYETNERVRVASVNSTTVTIVGQGANGGLRHNHANGVAVRNADSVYPVVCGTFGSLLKWWSPEVGEYGSLMFSERTGLLKQWIADSWKWYGAYARPVENRLVRLEVASSLDA